MNSLDARVIRCTGASYYRYGKWWRPVVYDCEGHESITEVMKDTKEEADNVLPGTIIQV